MKLDVLYEVDAPKPWGRPHPYGQRDAELRAYADARVHRIYAGTTEIMKELVARSL